METCIKTAFRQGNCAGGQISLRFDVFEVLKFEVTLDHRVDEFEVTGSMFEVSAITVCITWPESLAWTVMFKSYV